MWFPWLKKLRQDSHETQEMLKEQERTIRDASQAWDQKQTEIGSAIAAAIKTAAETVPDYERTQRNKEYGAQWAMFCVTALGTLFAAAAALGAWYYAGIAARQLCTMNQAAETSRRELLNTINSFREDERAWVEIGNIRQAPQRMIPKVGLIFRYELTLRNVGKTVARDVRLTVLVPQGSYAGITSKSAIAAYLEPKPPKGMELSRWKPEIPGAQSLAPAADAPVPAIVFAAEPHGKPAEGGPINSELLGEVTYLDAFGANHWMHFCYLVFEGGKLFNCPYGNEEDKNPEPKATANQTF